ncbi:membrane protein [Clostridium polyendosporum]|uniref:Membrane protein n=1 Tax=Clostridium polyendosporum TaxID=69208 RepID=A0A919RXP4_9CLOT|nr:PDZ domain-containing protein [Clostridium polyendosporum]GIM28266.1 membrane protein [Clostridium polyendosporum]
MDLAIHTLRSVAYAIVGPSYAFVLIIIGVMFYLQNKKTSFVQKMIIGESFNSSLELTLSQLVLGIFAGAIGSIMLTYLGVIFDENSGIEILFMISLLLMFYKPRFFCFAYSSSILGLISIGLNSAYASLGTQALINVNIISLITFVGVLHFIEGLLIIADGARGSIPVFTNKDGKILGGFAFKRYWAIPVSVILIVTGTADVATEQIGNPSWWPLIQSPSYIKAIAMAIITLMPFYGVLGYASVTFTKSKKEKIYTSGILTAIYGLLMIAVAQLGKIGVAGQLVAVIIVPLTHELMIILQNKLEEKDNPLYISDDDGIAILEVAPNSPAFQAGIKSGDKVIEINEEKVLSEIDAYNRIKESYLDMEMKIRDRKGHITSYSLRANENKRIGVVLVPKMVKTEDIINLDKKDFNEILDKLKNKGE